MTTFAKAAFVGIIAALTAVIAEQFLAVLASLFFQKEILTAVYTNLDFFLVAAALIEETIKYLSARRILSAAFGLHGFKFILASTIVGFFFGLTETYFILLANGKRISDFKTFGNETAFSLVAVVLVHVLTILFMALLIASRREKKNYDGFKTIFFPVFFHLLVNFLIIQKGAFTNWIVGIALGIVFAANLLIIAFNFRKLD